MNIRRIIRKLISCKEVMIGKANVAFSQYGEDLVIISLLNRMKADRISYLDIGANDPVLSSNTYNLYLRGHKGVLIEPNPVLCRKIQRKRPNDVCLNIGIGDGTGASANYYMFHESYNALNTFSAEEAAIREKEGISIQKVVPMVLQSINQIMEQHFPAEPPSLLSIDVEGLDEVILRSLDFNRYAPLIICVESTQYNSQVLAGKRQGVNAFLEEMGYMLYADSYANSIFCLAKQLN